eukprot:scaffold49701_cov33-Tisochrysis_lutea.AAC.1
MHVGRCIRQPLVGFAAETPKAHAMDWPAPRHAVELLWSKLQSKLYRQCDEARPVWQVATMICHNPHHPATPPPRPSLRTGKWREASSTARHALVQTPERHFLPASLWSSPR